MTLQRVAAAAWFLALAGCPGRIDDADKEKFLDAGSDAGTACTLNVETDILMPTCGTAGCHDATTMQNGLDLASPGIAMRISTQTSMCMGLSELQLIPKKLTATPPCGATMPITGPLTTEQANCIDAYIANLVADGGTP
jgi:hypothetical protein